LPKNVFGRQKHDWASKSHALLALPWHATAMRAMQIGTTRIVPRWLQKIAENAKEFAVIYDLKKTRVFEYVYRR